LSDSWKCLSSATSFELLDLTELPDLIELKDLSEDSESSYFYVGGYATSTSIYSSTSCSLKTTSVRRYLWVS